MRRVLLTGCVAVMLAFPLTSPGGSSAGKTWAGTWSTNWGTMTFQQTGSKVTGTYPTHLGRITGTAGGNVLSGRWEESAPPSSGTLVLTLGSTGKSFRGTYTIGGKPGETGLTGTCTGGDCLGNGGGKTAAWPPLPDALVSLASVSNGCGGGVAGTEKRFGDTSTYLDSNNPFGKRYVVNFRQACNVHDAGYSGARITDPFGGGIVDFWSWSQRRVDDRFLADMRTLCTRTIPASAPTALADCKGTGGKTSFGALTRYNFVRSQGHRFYRPRSNLAGTWSGAGLTVQIMHQARYVRGTWKDGDLTGEFRGTLISHDQDAEVRGFARTTRKGATKQSTLRIAVDPSEPDTIVVTGASLHGTLTR